MEFEFDKEIDSLLRQSAGGGETAFAGLENPNSQIPNPQPLHVDADEISLFAENVLPVKARVRVTEHLADCSRCRKILSDVIALNAETESENVHAKPVAAVLPASIPWYKNLLAFPQIAYTMGALALIFSGIIGILILKNATGSQNSSVAQIEKVRESQTSVQNDVSETAPVSADNNYAKSNSNAAANSNMSAATNSSMANTAAANSAANKSSGTLARPSSNPPVREEASVPAERNVTTESLTALSPKKQSDETASKDAVAGNAPTARREADNRADADETVTVSKNEAEAPKKSVAQTPPTASAAATLSSRSVSKLPVNRRSTSDLMLDGAEKEDKKARKTSAEATRTVSGKTFKRADGVWYDSAYNQQKTTNIRRGSNDYKKLDSGLRSIAENLGGTIVVVWKSKAYRIQ